MLTRGLNVRERNPVDGSAPPSGLFGDLNVARSGAGALSDRTISEGSALGDNPSMGDAWNAIAAATSICRPRRPRGCLLCRAG